MYRHEPNFQVDGLTTGYRTRELVESSAKRFEGPLREATRQYDTLINQIDCYQRLGERIRDVQDITTFTPDASLLVPAAVRTGNPEITGSAEPGAVMGDYSLTVLQLARATRIYSDSWQVTQVVPPPADATTPSYVPSQPLAAGTLTVTLASGQSATQPLGNGVAQAAVASGVTGMGLSISAQIIDDFGASPPTQTIMFSGLQLGAAMDFSLAASYDAPAAAGTLALNFSAYQAQRASDSEVQIDGRPGTVTSASREVAGVLPGVSLSLGDGVVLTSPPAATFLSLEMDGSRLREQVEAFLGAYNRMTAEFVRVRKPPVGTEKSRNPVEARERRDARRKALAGRAAGDRREDKAEGNAVALLKELLGQAEETPVQGVENLERDPFVGMLHEQLTLVLGNSVAGVAPYATLADVGIGPGKNALGGVDASGEQIIDDAKFDPVVSTRPLAIAQLLAGSSVPPITGIFNLLQNIFIPPACPDPSNPGTNLPADTVQIQIFRAINSCQSLAFTARDNMRSEYERLQGYKKRETDRFINLEKMKGNMQVTTDYLNQVVESMRNRQS